jgi:NADPH2:quinone reductase
VIDHRKKLAARIVGLGLGAPAFVFSTTNTGAHLSEIVELIAPQGRFGLIDDPASLDINPFKRKSVSVHWEFMFTRSMFETPDIGAQGDLLTEIARLVDAGTLRTTLAETFGPINAANLKRAHALLESGQAKARSSSKGSDELGAVSNDRSSERTATFVMDARRGSRATE